MIGDATPKKEPAEKIYVELLVKFEGSNVTNRITAFEMPILERVSGGEGGEDQLRFESKELLDGIIRAAKSMK
jgi:hypothetical protein